MAEYCNNCSKKLKNRDDKYKHNHHRGYCRTCLREVYSLVDSFDLPLIYKNFKKISHKLTSEEVQIVQNMVQLNDTKKKLESLKNTRLTLKKVRDLDEKELEELKEDINIIGIKIRIDHITQEIRTINLDIEGLMNHDIKTFENIIKKLNKISDEELN